MKAPSLLGTRLGPLLPCKGPGLNCKISEAWANDSRRFAFPAVALPATKQNALLINWRKKFAPPMPNAGRHLCFRPRVTKDNETNEQVSDWNLDLRPLVITSVSSVTWSNLSRKPRSKNERVQQLQLLRLPTGWAEFHHNRLRLFSNRAFDFSSSLLLQRRLGGFAFGTRGGRVLPALHR